VPVQSDLDELLDDPNLILRQTRERFIAAFPGRSASIASLAAAVAMLGAAGPLEALRHLTHRLTGTAGIAAMPGLRQRSSDLEQRINAVAKGLTDPADLAAPVRALADAFEIDLQQPAPSWATQAPEDAATERILVVDDDPAGRGPLRAALLEAGYRPFVVPPDSGLFDAIRIAYPALVLVNVDRSGLDGHAICQQLKATPEFATLPVVCAILEPATGQESGIASRIGGAMLRADDYGPGVGDPRELVQQVTATLHHRATSGGVTLPSGLLTYEAFAVAAQDVLSREPASLVVVRISPDRVWALTARIISSVRPRDLVGRYDEPHIVLCLPGVSTANAETRVREILVAGRSGRAVAGMITAGVASTTAPGRNQFDRLLIDADEALAAAGRRGELVMTAGEDRSRGADA
jgi:DNA-binding response OmpR family regulator